MFDISDDAFTGLTFSNEAVHLGDGFVETLEDYLSNKVFAGNTGESMKPDPKAVEGFNKFLDAYVKALAIERAAVKSF